MTSSLPVPFDYTNKDYTSIRAQLISVMQARFGSTWNTTDETDFGLVMVEAFSYVGDMLAYYIDRLANESNILTATQPDSVLNLASLYGYAPSLPQPSVATLTLTNSSASPVTVPAKTQFSATVPSTVASVVPGAVTANLFSTVVFESKSAVTVPASGNTTVVVTQGVRHDGGTGYGEVLGTSDGTPGQAFLVNTGGVLQGTVRVLIYSGGSNYSEWRVVDRTSDYGPLDTVAQVRFNSAGQVTVSFGDGYNGQIPPSGVTVQVVYYVGGGSATNVSAGTITKIIDPTNSFGALTCTNVSPASGGTDAETLASIRTNAPKWFSAMRRAVTQNDYAGLCFGVSGVYKANAVADLWTSPVVYIAPTSDGTLTPGKKAATISTIALTTNVVTVTTTQAHTFVVGDSVLISGLTGGNAVMNGTYTVTGVTSTTFTYALTNANIASNNPTFGMAQATTSASAAPAGAANATALANNVTTYLSKYAVLGTTPVAVMGNYAPVKITVGVTLYANASQRITQAAIQSAVIDYLSPDNVGFAASLVPSDIIGVIMSVPGVATVTVNNLYRLDSGYTSGIQTTTAAANEILTLGVYSTDPGNNFVIDTLSGGIADLS